MGTFLGNLQVLGAAEAEIAAVLPKAAVGRWSERFITVLDERLGYGSAGLSAKKLSGKLPQAVVLGVGLVDSDAVELSVWQAGKRITAQLDGYEGAPDKKGDPKKFCAALGLPDEDIPRLKGVWAKGDAEDKLELTAALLGAPLHCRVDWPPEERAVRDADAVDRWLAERPDPPKVKNQTRAEVIQEEHLLPPNPYYPSHIYFGQGESGCFMFSSLQDEEDEAPPLTVWRTAPDGTVYPWRELLGVDGSWDFKSSISGDRLLASSYSEGCLMFDSMGVLPVPLRPEGGAGGGTFDSLPNGGLVFWDIVDDPDVPGRRVGMVSIMDPDGRVHSTYIPGDFDTIAVRPGSPVYFEESVAGSGDGLNACFRFSRFGLDGTLLCQANFGWCAELCGGDGDGLWFAVPNYHQKAGPSYDLIRTTLELKELGRVCLPGVTVCETKFFKQYGIAVHTCFQEGLWVLSGHDLSVRASICDRRGYLFVGLDGAGRIWMAVGGSTLEAYDLDLKLLSRHRLKGSLILAPNLDSEGRLCVRTYDERRYILRAYRLS